MGWRPLGAGCHCQGHRREEQQQKYREASGFRDRCGDPHTLKSGNPKLPIALETGGKEGAQKTKRAPSLTTCLA